MRSASIPIKTAAAPILTKLSPDFSRMAVARKSRSFPQRDLAEEEAQSIRVIGECSIPQRK
jgi:hypothetical protein